MKKVLFLSAIKLLICEVSVSQKINFEIGINPNISYSYSKEKRLSNNTKEYPLIRSDFSGMISYGISAKNDLSYGIGYSTKGKMLKSSLIDYNSSSKEIDMTMNIVHNFIEIPVFIKHSVPKSKGNSFVKFGIIYYRLIATKALVTKVSDSGFNYTANELARQSSYMYVRQVIDDYDFRMNNFGIQISYGHDYSLDAKLY